MADGGFHPDATTRHYALRSGPDRLAALVAPRTHAYRLPRWPRGPKPRRRTELGLLVFAAVITVALYVIAELGAKNKIPPHLGPFLAVILGISLVAHLANRWLAPNANAVVLPLAALLNGIGYVIIVRWTPPAAKAQATWAALGHAALRAHPAGHPALAATSTATATCCCWAPASCWWPRWSPASD